MRRLTKGSFASALAYALALAVILPGLARAVTATADAARVKVIVLPLANNTKVGAAELADRVHRALQTTLAASDRVSIISLRMSSPAVRRALDIEKTLEPSDLDLKPPVSRAQAERIGRALGADIVLWGSVEEYTYDQKNKQVTLGLSVSKLDLHSGQVSVIAVTGKSSAKVGFAGGEGPLMTEAIDDAVGQVTRDVLGVAVAARAGAPTAPAPGAGKKKNKTWLIAGGLIAAAVGIALAASGGGGGGGAAPPVGAATNTVATPTADAVNLQWTSPSGATSFNIYRAELGGVSGRMARITRAPRSRVHLTRQTSGYSLLANVGRGESSYSDVSSIRGDLYAYKIAVVVGAAESAQTDFYSHYELGAVQVGPAYPSPPAMPTYTPFLQSLALQWTKNPEDFILNYRVYRSDSATGPWDDAHKLGEVAGSQNTFEDPGVGLVAGNTYYYAIGAVTAATSAAGRIGAPLQVLFQPGKPGPPSNVKAEPRINGVYLTWAASSDSSVTGYRIYRNGAMIAQVDKTQTSYEDTSLAPGVYTYAVASVAGTVEGDRVNAVPSPISPSSLPQTLTLTGPTTKIVANGTSTAAVYATARDPGGTPVQGVPVAFTMTAAGGSLGPLVPDYETVTEPLSGGTGWRVTTDANGKAGILFTAGADAKATPKVQAACPGVNNTTLTQTITIGLEARQVSKVTATASVSTLPGDGNSSTSVAAIVVDQGGGGFAGIPVTFSVSPSGAEAIGVFKLTDSTVTETSATTNEFGIARVTLVSAGQGKFGPCTVTATATGANVPAGIAPATVTVIFQAAPRVTVSIDPPTLPAAGLGSTALITATIKYPDGTPAADDSIVRFAFEGGQVMSANTGAKIADGTQRVLTKAGYAYATLISATNIQTSDSDLVWAWVDPDDDGVWQSGLEMLGSAIVSYTEPPYRVSVTADPLSIPADGLSVTKLVADVRTQIPDPSGGDLRPVADGSLVEFRTDAGTFIDSGAVTTTGRTVGGLVTVFLKAPSTQGVANVTATAALISGSVQVQFVRPADVLVSVAATPASLQADGQATSQIVARVQDNLGLPKASVKVTFSTSLGTLSQTDVTTDTKGDATTTLTAGIIAGTATVVAKSEGATGFATVTLTSGQAQNLALTIIAPNGSMPATNGMTSPSGASSSATVYARVTDQNGNPVVNGTSVFFHTDVGQIDGSALTDNGVAQATLLSSNFLDATNKATYRPGWASISAYATNPAGPAKAGPAYQIFCGDTDVYNWDGSVNDTDIVTGYGADWKLGSSGSADLSAQPNLVPRAGDAIRFGMILADRNNNPLPSGVKVHFRFKIGSTVINEQDVGTSLVHSPGGVDYCSTFASVTVNKFPGTTPPPVVTLVAEVTTPVIISDQFVDIPVAQNVGAASPAGSFTPDSPAGTSLQLTQNPDGPFTLTAGIGTARVNDKFANPVQDGTPVTFTIQSPTNVSESTVSFSPNPAPTNGGIATTAVTIGLLDETRGGNFTVLATAGDAKGTLALSVKQPPQPTRELLVDYNVAQLVETYPVVSPGLKVVESAFAIRNIGDAESSVRITNVPDDPAKAPVGYVTFRLHSTSPPTQEGDKVLFASLGVGESIIVDVIVDTNGLTVAQSPYNSQISVTSTDSTVTYAPADNPQRLFIVVQ